MELGILGSLGCFWYCFLPNFFLSKRGVTQKAEGNGMGCVRVRAIHYYCCYDDYNYYYYYWCCEHAFEREVLHLLLLMGQPDMAEALRIQNIDESCLFLATPFDTFFSLRALAPALYICGTTLMVFRAMHTNK